ncbi:MAG: DUF983 domain-containing protein [Planctomycetota bacterium]|nr:DUF983 domain-containing protein [Planctomycetota bacterium]
MLRCPRCFRGAVFSGILKMHRNCPVCQLEYVREPGYFLGAMYFSYGMSIIVALPGVIVLMRFGVSLVTTFVIAFLFLAILSPILVRYSRVLWFHFEQLVDPR